MRFLGLNHVYRFHYGGKPFQKLTFDQCNNYSGILLIKWNEQFSGTAQKVDVQQSNKQAQTSAKRLLSSMKKVCISFVMDLMADLILLI